MSSTKTDPTIVFDTGSSSWVRAVAFHPDEIHLFGGVDDGIRRWRLEDCQQVGKQMGMDLIAISISKDRKWVACGTEKGASVWDEEIQEKVVDVEDGNAVNAVDVSPDSTTFATGTDTAVNIWRITSGERLVGPLKHDTSYVIAVRFSPNGERIATASSGRSIRIFDSRKGDELITIETVAPTPYQVTPLAWSDDGLQIFTASADKKVKLFDVSTGSQLAESQSLSGHDDLGVFSIALAANRKFIGTFVGSTISFLDTSTLSLIDPVIEDSKRINSIALSPDSSYLATGLDGGKIAIHDLSGILPDVYGPFHTFNHEARKLNKQPPISGSRGNKSSDSPEDPRKPNPVESETRGEDRADDFLEVEVPSGVPAFDFDFDEPSSPASSTHHEDEGPPLDASHAAPQLSNTVPIASPPLACAEERVDTVESSHGTSKFKKWVRMRVKKSNKDPTSHERDQSPRRSRPPAGGQSPSESPARVDATNKGPSWMAAGQRVPRMVATSPEEPKTASSSGLYARIRQALQTKSSTEDVHPSHPNEDTSRTVQGSANPPEVGPVQQVNDASHPSAGGVHLTRESGKAILKFSIAFPGWMCCGSAIEDKMHSPG